MNFTITLSQEQINLIQGVSLKSPLVAEVLSGTTFESVTTKLKLTGDLDAPVNFQDVFESIEVKNTYNDYPMDVLTYVPEGSEVKLNEMYSLAENTSEIYEINFELKPEFLGKFNLTLETSDANTGVIAEKTIKTDITNLENALINYEEQVVKLNDAEVSEIETGYQELESKRILVQSAISALEDSKTKNELMDRYWIAAGNQYSAYKLLLLHLSANNHLDLVAVKNVGGNYPYQLSFRDKMIVGDATEAIRFYPKGYKATQTGNELFPSDYPENIASTIVVGQEKILIENNFIQTGEFIQVYKIDGVWYRLLFTLQENEEGTIALSSVEGYDVEINENGDEFYTPVEADMRDAISNIVFEGELVQAQDAELPLVLKTSLTHPTYGSNIHNGFTLDYIVTSNVAIPAGTIITAKLNDLEFGVPFTLTEELSSFRLSTLLETTMDTLNFRTGTDVLELTFENLKPGAKTLSVRAVVAEEGEHDSATARYSLANFTGLVQLLDRRGALEHAVTNTSLEIAGDMIETLEEGIILKMKATYPEFHSELDPELKVDTLLTFDKPITPNFTIKIELDGVVVADRYMPEGYEFTELWLSYLLENVPPTLIEHSGKEVEYTITMHAVESGIFSMDTKLITAKEDQFDIPAARTTLASVVSALEVTDKTELITLITSTEQLLVTHIEGEEPGNASATAREALQLAIDTVKVILEDDDATLNDIQNAIESLTNAVNTFKDSVVKITINKVNLDESINRAQGLIDTIEVGINAGQTSKEDKDALQTVLDSAREKMTTLPDQISYFDTESTVQTQIDTMTEDLSTAIVTFEDSIITDTEYVDARLTEYEQAALDFYNNLRKKLNI